MRGGRGRVENGNPFHVSLWVFGLGLTEETTTLEFPETLYPWHGHTIDETSIDPAGSEILLKKIAMKKYTSYITPFTYNPFTSSKWLDQIGITVKDSCTTKVRVI